MLIILVYHYIMIAVDLGLCKHGMMPGAGRQIDA